MIMMTGSSKYISEGKPQALLSLKFIHLYPVPTPINSPNNLEELPRAALHTPMISDFANYRLFRLLKQNLSPQLFLSTKTTRLGRMCEHF
jgi:hypothetical protein